MTKGRGGFVYNGSKTYDLSNTKDLIEVLKLLGWNTTGAWGDWQLDHIKEAVEKLGYSYSLVKPEDAQAQAKKTSNLTYFPEEHVTYSYVNYVPNPQYSFNVPNTGYDYKSLAQLPTGVKWSTEVALEDGFLASPVTSSQAKHAEKYNKVKYFPLKEEYRPTTRIFQNVAYDIGDPILVLYLQHAINKYLGVDHLDVNGKWGAHSAQAFNNIDYVKLYYDNKRKNLAAGETLTPDKDAFIIKKNGKIYGTTAQNNGGFWQEYDGFGNYKARDARSNEKGAISINGQLYDLDTEAAQVLKLLGLKETGTWTEQDEDDQVNLFSNISKEYSDTNQEQWKKDFNSDEAVISEDGTDYSGKWIRDSIDKIYADIPLEARQSNSIYSYMRKGMLLSGGNYSTAMVLAPLVDTAESVAISTFEHDWDDFGNLLEQDLQNKFGITFPKESLEFNSNTTNLTQEQILQIINAPENQKYARAVNYIQNALKYIASKYKNDNGYGMTMLSRILDNTIAGALKNLGGYYQNKNKNQSDFSRGVLAERYLNKQQHLNDIGWDASDENIASLVGAVVDAIPDLFLGTGIAFEAAKAGAKKVAYAAVRQAMARSGGGLSKESLKIIANDAAKQYVKQNAEAFAKAGVKDIATAGTKEFAYWTPRGTVVNAGNLAYNTGNIDWGEAIKEGLQEGATMGILGGALKGTGIVYNSGIAPVSYLGNKVSNIYWSGLEKLGLSHPNLALQLAMPGEALSYYTPLFLKTTGNGIKQGYNYVLGNALGIDAAITSWANNANVGASRFIRRPLGVIYDASTFSIKHPITSAITGLESLALDEGILKINPDINPIVSQMLAGSISGITAPIGINYGKMKILSSATNKNGLLFNSFLGKNINNQTATGQLLRDKLFTGLDPRVGFWRNYAASTPLSILNTTFGNIPNIISYKTTGNTISQNLQDLGVNEEVANTLDSSLMLGLGNHASKRYAYTVREMSGGKQGFQDLWKYFINNSGKQIYIPGLKYFSQNYYRNKGYTLNDMNRYQRFITEHGINRNGIFTGNPQSNYTPLNKIARIGVAFARALTATPGRNYNLAYHSSDTPLLISSAGSLFAGHNLPEYNLTSYKIFGTPVKGLQRLGNFVMSDRMPLNLTSNQKLGWYFVKHNRNYLGNGQHFSLNEWSRSPIMPENWNLVLMSKNARNVDLNLVSDRTTYQNRKAEILQKATRLAEANAKKNPELVENYIKSLDTKERGLLVNKLKLYDLKLLQRLAKLKILHEKFPGKSKSKLTQEELLKYKASVEAYKQSSEYIERVLKLEFESTTPEYKTKAKIGAYARNEGKVKVAEMERNTKEFLSFLAHPERRSLLDLMSMLNSGKNPWQYQFWSTTNPAVGRAGFKYRSGNNANIMNDITGHGEIALHDRNTGEYMFLYGDHGEAGSGAKNNTGIKAKLTNWFMAPWLSNVTPRMYTFGVTGGTLYAGNTLSKNNKYKSGGKIKYY